MGILPKYFVSVDWGTTNFRLRVVETATLVVLKEIQSNDGVKTMYSNFKDQKELSQEEFFMAYLEQKINHLPSQYRQGQIIVSGMASSSIGMSELEYAELPFGTDGQDLIWKRLLASSGVDIILVSGVRSQSDIMRGEEVQAIGIETYITQHAECVIVLPGTHSKHILFGNGKFKSFNSFMTGELFELLSKQSILSSSIEKSTWNDENKKSFLKGVRMGVEKRMTASLFSVRAMAVTKQMNPNEGFYFLSGLLIGDELSYLKNTSQMICLVASDSIFNLYKEALLAFIDEYRLILLNGELLEQALLIGQIKILTLINK